MRYAILATCLALAACGPSESQIKTSFLQQCKAAAFTKAQCDLYYTMDLHTRQARDSAGTAVALAGISIGLSASRGTSP